MKIPNLGAVQLETALFQSRALSLLKILGCSFLPFLAIYTVAFDQGALARLIGLDMQAQMFFHEFFHDFRHVAGFMCH